MNFKTVDKTKGRIRWVLIERQERSIMPSKATGTTGTTDSQIVLASDTIVPLATLSAFESQIASRYQSREGETLKTFEPAFQRLQQTKHVNKYSYFPPRFCLSSHKIVAIARVSSTARLYLTSVPMAVSSMWHSPSFFMPRSIRASIETFRSRVLAVWINIACWIIARAIAFSIWDKK